jgi:hypothetical protein
MRVAHNWGKVRIVHDGSPFDVLYDVKVEVLRNGEWKFYDGYNSLSNDYAFSESQKSAGRAIKELAAEAAATLPGV